MLIRACTTGVRLATDLDSLQLALYLEWKRKTRRQRTNQLSRNRRTRKAPNKLNEARTQTKHKLKKAQQTNKLLPMRATLDSDRIRLTVARVALVSPTESICLRVRACVLYACGMHVCV